MCLYTISYIVFVKPCARSTTPKTFFFASKSESVFFEFSAATFCRIGLKISNSLQVSSKQFEHKKIKGFLICDSSFSSRLMTRCETSRHVLSWSDKKNNIRDIAFSDSVHRLLVEEELAVSRVTGSKPGFEAKMNPAAAAAVAAARHQVDFSFIYSLAFIHPLMVTMFKRGNYDPSSVKCKYVNYLGCCQLLSH